MYARHMSSKDLVHVELLSGMFDVLSDVFAHHIQDRFEKIICTLAGATTEEPVCQRRVRAFASQSANDAASEAAEDSTDEPKAYPARPPR